VKYVRDEKVLFFNSKLKSQKIEYAYEPFKENQLSRIGIRIHIINIWRDYGNLHQHISIFYAPIGSRCNFGYYRLNLQMEKLAR
jgi:hypothetical protein